MTYVQEVTERCHYTSSRESKWVPSMRCIVPMSMTADTGYLMPLATMVCDRCGGTGRWLPRPTASLHETCPDCGGTPTPGLDARFQGLRRECSEGKPHHEKSGRLCPGWMVVKEPEAAMALIEMVDQVRIWRVPGGRRAGVDIGGVWGEAFGDTWPEALAAAIEAVVGLEE